MIRTAPRDLIERTPANGFAEAEEFVMIVDSPAPARLRRPAVSQSALAPFGRAEASLAGRTI